MAVIQELVALLGFEMGSDADLKRFENGIGRAEGRLKTFSKTAVKTAQTIAVGLGTALAGAATKTTADAIDYEDAFAGVEKVLTATPAQLEKLSDQFLDLASDIGLPIPALLQIAEAQGQAGVAAEDLAERTRLVAVAAKALDLDAEQAGTQMATFAAIFGLGSDQLEDFLDTINHVSNTTNAKAGQITAAVTKSAGAIKNLGLTRHDLVGLTAGLIATGSHANTAGLAINNLGTRLATNRKDTIKGVSDLGLSIDGLMAQINQGQGVEAIQSILNALNNVEDATDRSRIASEIFGNEYGKNWTAAAAGIDTFNGSITNANDEMARAGALYDEFNKQNNTAKSILQVVKNAITAVSTTIGQEFLPLVKESGRQVIAWAKEFRKSEDLKTFARVLKDQVVAIGNGIKFISGQVIEFIGNVRTVYNAFMQWAEAVGIADQATTAITTALALLAVFLFPIPATIAAIVLAFNDFFNFINGKDSVIGDLIGGMGGYLSQFQDTWNNMWTWAQDRFEVFATAFGPAMDQLSGAFGGIVDLFSLIVESFSNLETAEGSANRFLTILTALADLSLIAVGAALSGIATALHTLIDAFNLFIQGDFFGAWMRLSEGIQEAFGIIFDAVLEATRVLLEFFGEVFGFDGAAIFDGLVAAFENLPARLNAAWGSFSSWMKQKSAELGKLIASTLTSYIPDFAKDLLGISSDPADLPATEGDEPTVATASGGIQPPSDAGGARDIAAAAQAVNTGSSFQAGTTSQSFLASMDNLSAKLNQAAADGTATTENIVNNDNTEITNIDQDNRSTITINQTVNGATAAGAAGAAVRNELNRANSNRGIAVDAGTAGGG